jgi:flagellar P-ring protein FlgI
MHKAKKDGLRWVFWLAVLTGLAGFSTEAAAARIKDLAAIKGIRTNQISGYSLVVGLNGTGDKDKVTFTRQALANMMEKMNISVDESQLKVKNVAAVMATASIPAFARIGDRLDVTVSSMGDAQSLKGGTLLMTYLKGVDGRVYAIAQGPVSLSIPGEAEDRDSHLLVGRIINGGSIEREIPFRLDGKKNLTLSLFYPDFTTARRMTDTINAAIGNEVAKTLDASAISLTIPEDMWQAHVAEFISDIESLNVVPDTKAKVVVNERTGTVVIGADVSISQVAIAHGNLSVTINEGQEDEEEESLMNLPASATIGELVRGLNALGVQPRDLIGILQSMKAAGALQAELEII